MDKDLFPLTLIYAQPMAGNVRRAINDPAFDRKTIRMQMNIVCAYLNYVCLSAVQSARRPKDMQYEFGLSAAGHQALIEYCDDYLAEIIEDTLGVERDSKQANIVRMRVLLKVTGTQMLPIIIAVDSESKKDRELYDRHM